MKGLSGTSCATVFRAIGIQRTNGSTTANSHDTAQIALPTGLWVERYSGECARGSYVSSTTTSTHTSTSKIASASANTTHITSQSGSTQDKVSTASRGLGDT